MDNELFKKFIDGYVSETLECLGGATQACRMYEQLPSPTLYFVAGGVCAMVAKSGLQETPWRPGATARQAVVFTQEEIRRTLDYVRLRLETWSKSS